MRRSYGVRHQCRFRESQASRPRPMLLAIHPIQEHLYTGVVGPSIRVVVGLSYRTTAYFAISDAGGSYDAKMAIKQQ